MNRLTSHLITLTALLTIVLTIALPALELLTSPTSPTTPADTPAPTTTQASPTPRISKADKAAAHHDGCRQASPNDNLLARPSCRSGMPITRDRGLAQAPNSPHDNRSPAPLPTVPPAWADHWGAAAHSPYHRSQA